MPEDRYRAARRRWVAILAAYLLVLQAVVTGLASGAYAADNAIARSIGMTLCAPVGDHQQGEGADAAHAERMERCLMACALGAGFVGAPSAGHEPVIYRAVDRVAFARQLDTPQGYVGGRSPANPRAPPVLH
ncbi:MULTISPECIES: DUF2946 family protein [unclassified Bosea (in: a-proteobacteria)]|uniref:DUF2946 family protein n=1 Tax=Bosea sp. (in: a-proteobacteria) TaxID=1871050 RepID=UPI001ACE6F0F|nr:DUF2946 family protein [Bosea sp. (in: a-proteobacteria)]MBN9470990.1 hypothetical protein [Bosea sp. (in: a-proteobacteria)]